MNRKLFLRFSRQNRRVKPLPLRKTIRRVDTENIGARRLYTIMERMLEELSFAAPDRPRWKSEMARLRK